MLISQAAYDRINAEADRAKAALARVKEASTEVVAEAVSTSETLGAAALVGALKGYTGKNEVFGVPIELASGGALLLLGALGVGGSSYAPHLVAAGKGPLASWAATFGESFGRNMKAKSGSPAPKAAGELVGADEYARAQAWRQNIENAAASL